jgi:hypothetical protein
MWAMVLLGQDVAKFEVTGGYVLTVRLVCLQSLLLWHGVHVDAQFFTSFFLDGRTKRLLTRSMEPLIAG